MMCTTVQHGGVCHRTSTPHKSGIKMKEKKKFPNNTDVFEAKYGIILFPTNFYPISYVVCGGGDGLYFICIDGWVLHFLFF